MAAKPPFDLVRALFWVIAIVVVTSVLMTDVIATLCAIAMIRGTLAHDRCRELELRDFIMAMVVALVGLVSLMMSGKPPPGPPDE